MSCQVLHVVKQSRKALTSSGGIGCCRGLALLPNIGVVSASHDQTLRVWTFSGECIAELVGHTALVYSAACSDDGGLIASASEDSTVRIWRPDGQCLQTLEHPGTDGAEQQAHCNECSPSECLQSFDDVCPTFSVISSPVVLILNNMTGV